MKNIINIFFIVIVIICSRAEGQERNYIDSTINTNENNIPLDSLQYYYPSELFFSKDTLINNHIIKIYANNELYSRILFKLKEPLLFNKYMDKEVYRLLIKNWIGAGCFRIEKSSDSINYLIKDYFKF